MEYWLAGKMLLRVRACFTLLDSKGADPTGQQLLWPAHCLPVILWLW